MTLNMQQGAKAAGLVRAAQGAAPRPRPAAKTRAATLEREMSEVAQERMALHQKTDHSVRREENIAGSWWVDETCIDCDTCRWMAPGVFHRDNGQTAVYAHPRSHAETIRAAQALVSCPTFSIHSGETPALMKEAREALPEPIESAPGAFYCGYNSKDSFGGNGYLLLREGGNVLIDSPRYTPALAKQLKAMGGAKYIFLTHKDDVADHAKWAEVLGATRIIHKGECNDEQGTTACELQLEGEGPWRLPDGGEDAELIWTPGHTETHLCLYYAPSKVLFGGDHIAGGHENPGEIYIYRDFNWYDFELQKKSVEKLLAWDWETVLPGHGRRGFFKDQAHREQAVKDMYQRFA